MKKNIFCDVLSLAIFVSMYALVLFLTISPILIFADAPPVNNTSVASPGTVVNVSNGQNTWNFTTSAISSDDSYAMTYVPFWNMESNYLRATNFGFSIPAGSTIDGVTVSIEKRGEASDYIYDYTVKLVKANVMSGSTRRYLGIGRR